MQHVSFIKTNTNGKHCTLRSITAVRNNGLTGTNKAHCRINGCIRKRKMKVFGNHTFFYGCRIKCETCCGFVGNRKRTCTQFYPSKVAYHNDKRIGEFSRKNLSQNWPARRTRGLAIICGTME